MKLYIPYAKKYWISQKYSENATAVYNENGRKGHGAFDIVGLDDKDILAACDAYVYSVRNVDPGGDPMQYSAAYTLVEDNGIFYELVYGHVSASLVKPGEYVKRGQKIALEGNRGYVASAGKEVTREEKEGGSKKGTHLHFQLRIVKPTEKRLSGYSHLKDSKGYIKKDGMYFAVLNYDNGYLGCVDPEPFMVYQNANAGLLDMIIAPFIEKPITRNLRYGSRGEDVKILQKKLGGLKVDGHFGKLTDAAVRAFQKQHKLKVDGIVGPKTIASLYGEK